MRSGFLSPLQCKRVEDIPSNWEFLPFDQEKGREGSKSITTLITLATLKTVKAVLTLIQRIMLITFIAIIIIAASCKPKKIETQSECSGASPDFAF